MRADRLVACLLILQARGRVTAAELAAELEVSVRTARRDLEALATAGIPVYAQRGSGGGWSLLGGARTDLTGLTAAEARALFLLAGPTVRFDPAARAALRKLVQALPEPFRAGASSAASAIVLDPAGWGGRRRPEPAHLALLQQAVIDGVQVRLTYAGSRGSESVRTVAPLGLVEKGPSWYLVADTDAGIRTFRLDRVRSAELTQNAVVRPPEFDLGKEWEAIVASVEERRRRVRAIVRVDAGRLPGLKAQFGDDLTTPVLADDGWYEVTVLGASSEILANELAGWGHDIEVVKPAAVRKCLARIGSELAEQYARG